MLPHAPLYFRVPCYYHPGPMHLSNTMSNAMGGDRSNYSNKVSLPDLPNQITNPLKSWNILNRTQLMAQLLAYRDYPMDPGRAWL